MNIALRMNKKGQSSNKKTSLHKNAVTCCVLKKNQNQGS